LLNGIDVSLRVKDEIDREDPVPVTPYGEVLHQGGRVAGECEGEEMLELDELGLPRSLGWGGDEALKGHLANLPELISVNDCYGEARERGAH
jgi:hypothetical protein